MHPLQECFEDKNISKGTNASETHVFADMPPGCSRCKVVIYSGYACQKQHWKEQHKGSPEVYKALMERREELELKRKQSLPEGSNMVGKCASLEGMLPCDLLQLQMQKGACQGTNQDVHCGASLPSFYLAFPAHAYGYTSKFQLGQRPTVALVEELHNAT